MGQVSLPNMAQSIDQNKSDQPETMSRVWTFESQAQASRMFGPLQELHRNQYPYEIQLLELYQQEVPQNGYWKVIAVFEYPELSLKKHLISRKKTRHFYLPSELSTLLALSAAFLELYSPHLSPQVDVLAHLFFMKDEVKICHPVLLYPQAAHSHEKKGIDKQRVTRQLFELLLLQKIGRAEEQHVNKVTDMYRAQWLTTLCAKIIQPNSDVMDLTRMAGITSVPVAHSQILSVPSFQNCITPKFNSVPSSTQQQIKEDPFAFPTKACKFTRRKSPYRQLELPMTNQMLIKDFYSNQNIAESIVQEDQISTPPAPSKQFTNFEHQDRPLLSIESKDVSVSCDDNVYSKNWKDSIPEQSDQSLNQQSQSLGTSKPEWSKFQIQGIGRYQGLTVNGRRQGKGFLYYHDGMYYDGDWQNDEMNGYGELYYSESSIAYQGFWRDGQFNGKGYMRNELIEPIEGAFDYTDFSHVGLKWKEFRGSFLNDEKEGKGVLVLSNGEQFSCSWVRNMAQGMGQFTKLNGEMVTGIWTDNLLCQSVSTPSSQSGTSRANTELAWDF